MGAKKKDFKSLKFNSQNEILCLTIFLVFSQFL